MVKKGTVDHMRYVIDRKISVNQTKVIILLIIDHGRAVQLMGKEKKAPMMKKDKSEFARFSRLGVMLEGDETVGAQVLLDWSDGRNFNSHLTSHRRRSLLQCPNSHSIEYVGNRERHVYTGVMGEHQLMFTNYHDFKTLWVTTDTEYGDRNLVQIFLREAGGKSCPTTDHYVPL